MRYGQEDDPTMERKTCPSCGTPLQARHLQGLCPACLLKEGLQTHESTHGGALPACAACGSPLGDGARFCASCGTAAPVAAADGDPMRAALEAKLRGQYRIIRLLGRGGMGAVYLARDLTLDREVAIKVMKTAGDREEIYGRLRREAKAAARLSHPNIVPLHAFGDVEGTPYVVMGYVRGEPLAARLRRDGRLPEEDARRILAEVADALDHAHRQGIVHRDIKPDNVLLDDESGRALLTDFGVAKALGGRDTLTAAGHVVGTPHYMSPEQASGRGDVDGRTDVYSLGVMAYAMLSGRLPFEGATAGDVLAQQLTQAPPPLRSLVDTLSDSTVQAVDRCLAKDPAKRWPDARSLKLVLGAVEEGSLPDALREAQSKGHLGLAVTLLYMYLLSRTGAPWVPYAMTLTMAGSVLLYTLVRLRREGIAVGRGLRAIFADPSWWLFWYPAPLRRTGNVWPRLPGIVRAVRWGLPVLAAYIGFALWLQGVLRGKGSIFVTGPGMLVLFWIWVAIRAAAKRRLGRHGLGPVDIERVMLTMPLSRASFWARPHVAPVLSAPTPTVVPGAGDSPHDQLQAILRDADELSGPLRPLGTEAAAAARQLLTAIEQADQEIAKLVRNVEPGEEERLAEKIAALGLPDGGGDENAPMRLLLEKQRELVRSLSARVAEAGARRNRRVEMLKTLALHVASLRARSVEPAGEVGPLSDRVRVLCDDIARQAASVGASATAHDDMTTLDGGGASSAGGRVR